MTDPRFQFVEGEYGCWMARPYNSEEVLAVGMGVKGAAVEFVLAALRATSEVLSADDLASVVRVHLLLTKGDA